ncbi:MAG: AI-2E family transporter [Candidatus Gastranaerophilales bacterium]|nr:AI-2E family transporter [Candidatus Gastranaerophilales bacterium]
MTFKNSITTKNIIFLLMVILLIKFFSQITTTAMLFFAAYVFACSLNPLVDKFSKKLNRPMAASIVMGGITLVLFAVFLPLVVVAIRQIELVVVALPYKINGLKDFILHKQILGQTIISMIDIPSFVEPVSKFTTNFVNQSIALTMNFASALIYLLALCVITYYFIVDKDTIRKGFMLLFPDHIKKKADTILTTISEKIGNYIIAQMTVIAGVGLCVMIPLMIMKIDCAVLLGVLSAILDLIPIIGPTIALIICIIMCYQMGPITVGLVIFFFLLAQWIENNFVRPYVFGKFMDLHPLIVFFAIFVTAKFLGAIGVIFAPAIAATICVLLDELYIKPINREIEP